MKNIITIVSIIAFFVIGIFIGNAQWFKNLFTPKANSGGGAGGNGTPCTTPDGSAGTITNGTCVKGESGGAGDGANPNERLSDNSSSRTSSAPPIVLIPASNKCQAYTSANPYKHMGCSYVFGGYISQNGIRMCQLKIVSCP